MFHIRPDDMAINGFPLFHVAGSMVFGLSLLAGGAGLLLPTRLGVRHPDVIAHYWEHVAEHRVSFLSAVPTLLAALLSQPYPEADISCVRRMVIGGSPLPTEMADAFEETYGIPVRNAFGMTESAGIVTIEPYLAPARVRGSCGLPLPHTEVIAAALGPDGADVSKPVPTGETGVIAVHGPNVSPGYTDRKRNAGTFTEDGWLISGDLGHLDENGYVYVTGRSKDVIIRGAHNIDPAMVEEIVNRHPAVEMSAAVGQPDAYAGELPVVYVALKPDMPATEEEILAFVTPLIAERPAVPKRVHILPDLPQTALRQGVQACAAAAVDRTGFRRSVGALAGRRRYRGGDRATIGGGPFGAYRAGRRGRRSGGTGQVAPARLSGGLHGGGLRLTGRLPGSRAIAAQRLDRRATLERWPGRPYTLPARRRRAPSLSGVPRSGLSRSGYTRAARAWRNW